MVLTSWIREEMPTGLLMCPDPANMKSLVLILSFARAVLALNQDFFHFTNIFGEERLKTHFTTEHDFAAGIRHEVGELAIDDIHHQVACVSVAHGQRTRALLVSLLGEESVKTVYTSRANNAACFLVTTEANLLTSINTVLYDQDIRSWTPIPTTLKIHHSAMYYLGLVDHNSHLHGILSRKLFARAQSIDFSRLEMIVSTHFNAVTLIQQIKSKLSTHPSLYLHEVMKASSHSVWSSAHFELLSVASIESWGGHHDSEHEPLHPSSPLASKVSDLCHFSSLSLHPSDPSTIVIRGLYPIRESSSMPMSCFAGLLALIVTHKSVLDIRLRAGKFTHNNFIKGIIQTDVREDDTYPYTEAGLNGTGQIIGVGDTGVDEYSCFFTNGDGTLVTRSSYDNPTWDLTRRKVVQYIDYMDGTDNTEGHGSHVCGTVGGNVVSTSPEYDSMTPYNGHAPAAKIAMFDMSTDGNSIYYPEPLGDSVFGAAYQAGVKIHSNSWGGPFNFYDKDTINADAFLYNHDDFLALFAAGNDGADGYYSLGDPAVSKNMVSVGASNSTAVGSMAYFSSMGPSFDERIKPDVVAPGYSTYSCNSSGVPVETCKVIRFAGTSMATPAVAGAAATIRQYFEDSRFYATHCTNGYPLCRSFSPKGSTVKAMLVSSGEAMKNYYTAGRSTTEPTAELGSPPDFYQGFGRVSLQDILPYPGIESLLNLYVDEFSLASLSTVTYTVRVTSTARPLKATLVWMDPPNSIISGKLLLHDLDIKVTSPNGGSTYYGNNNPADEVNNVEQVTIPVPAIGVYTVVVTSHTFTESDLQAVSVIITSAGVVLTRTEGTTFQPGNQIGCTVGYSMVTVTLMDRGGDGWGDGNTYSIFDSTGLLIRNGTMTSAIPGDIISYESFCLQDALYSVRLLQYGENSNEMGLEIDSCGVYLSEFNPIGSFNIGLAGRCNVCNGYELDIILIGSLYAVPYGWAQGSKYTITGSNINYGTGTLVTGVSNTHKICVAPGRISSATYTLELSGVPATDDANEFFDDDYSSSMFGVEEYRIGVINCVNGAPASDDDDNIWSYLTDDSAEPYLTAHANAPIFITIAGNNCTATTTSNKKKDSSNDDRLSEETIVGIVVGALAFVAASVFGVWYYLRWKRRNILRAPLVQNQG